LVVSRWLLVDTQSILFPESLDQIVDQDNEARAQFIEQNKINIASNKESYKCRQAIVEYPYGIIKRQGGFLFHHDKKRQEKGQC